MVRGLARWERPAGVPAEPDRGEAEQPMERASRVLLVEDDEDHAELVGRAFAAHPGFRLVVAASVAEGRRALEVEPVDLVISDYKLPDGEGTDLIGHSCPSVPVIVMTSHGSEGLAVRAMKAGALDYLVKSSEAFLDMPHVAERALREWRHIQQRDAARAEQRRQQKESERQREFSESVFNTAEAAVLVLEEDGTIVRFNPFFEQISGYPLVEAIGADWFEMFHVDDPDEHRELFQRAARGQPLRGYVASLRTRDGEVRSVEWSASQLRDADGEPTGLVAIGRDVTERLAAERERERLRLQLLERERLAAVGTAAAMLAHEISNPLNNMFLHAQLVQRRLGRSAAKDDERLEGGMQNILGEIRRLNGLLEEFRALSRKQQLNLQPTDLDELLDAICRDQEPSFSALEVSVEKDLACGSEPARVDREKIRQVMINLCKNACEAMPQGGTLRVRSKRTGDQISIQIQDTGVGIPEGVDVFEPFHTTKAAGTGLGLAIVRQIVEAHCGSISYVSHPNRGTTFYCSLPLAPPSEGIG